MVLCRGVPVCHVLAVILGSLEIVLFAGVIFGWHSVVYIYKDVGYFAGGCDTPKPKLPDADFGNSSYPHKPLAYNVDSTYSSPSVVVYTTPATTVVSILNSSADNEDHQDSIHFDQLTCKEQMAIRAEAGGTSRVCASQDEQFYLIFSLSTGLNGMLSFPSGILYDRLGTRISRIISVICFLGGQFCLIFASPEVPGLLYPGFMGLVYGGYQILLTNLQLGGLIPNLRSTIMSLYSGSYDTSSAIFLLFKAAYEEGVSINMMFAIQASLYFIIFASSTFLLLPKRKIPSPLPPNFRLRSYLCQKFCRSPDETASKDLASQEWKVDANGSIILVPKLSQNLGHKNASQEPLALQSTEPRLENTTGEAESVNKGEDHTLPLNGSATNQVTKEDVDFLNLEILVESDDGKLEQHSDLPAPESEEMIEKGKSKGRKTFWQVALSPLCLTDLMYMSFQRLRSWIFVGMFNPWITRLACGDKKLVSHYTSVYAGLQFFGIFTAPLSGLLMDRKIKGAEKYGNPRYERLHASIASFVLEGTVSVVLTVCTLIPVLEVQYATFALHCLHRSFLYGPNSAFVANAFPNEHFGKLFGTTLTVSALFSCIQYPLFLIMQGPLGGDPFYINVFLLILMLLSFIHPIYIWRYLQKKVVQQKQ